MKLLTAKLALSASIATLLCPLAHSSDQKPTFSGILYPAVPITQTTTTKTFADGTVEKDTKKARPELLDNGSRMRVTGSKTLDSNMDVLYRIEVRSPTDADASDVSKKQSFTARDTWLAIKHKDYGTLKAGRLVTPEPYTRYTYTTLPTDIDGTRTNNSIRWESPIYQDGALKDTQLMVHYVLDENGSADTVGTDAVGLFANHAPADDKYALGIAYIYSNDKANKYQFRTTGKYDITDQYQVNFIYQQNGYNSKNYGDSVDSKLEQGLSVGGQFKSAKDAKNTYYAQVNTAKNPAGKDGDSKALIVGVERAFVPNRLLLGAEYGAYHKNFDVPTHTETNNGTTNTVKSHKLEEKTNELFIYSTIFF